MRRIIAVGLTSFTVACGTSDGDDTGAQPGSESSSSSSESSVTIIDPSSSSSEPTSSGDPSSSSGPNETDTDTETETGGEVCQHGDAELSLQIELGDLPVEMLGDPEEAGTRVVAACTWAASGTTGAIELSCTGADDAEHAVSIFLGASAPAIPDFVEDEVYTLRVNSWRPFHANCITEIDEELWFSVRDDEGGLVVAGIDAGSIAVAGDDDATDLLAPFALALDTSTCAPTSGGGDTEGACATRDEGVAISTADVSGPTLVTGQEADFLDAHFAVGLATTQVLDGESLGCCDEGDLTAVRVLIVAMPPA